MNYNMDRATYVFTVTAVKKKKPLAERIAEKEAKRKAAKEAERKAVISIGHLSLVQLLNSDGNNLL